MADLKPCPFCGYENCADSLLGRCDNCGATAGCQEAWLSRPIEDAKDATIERMRGLLGEALPELELSRNRYHNTSRSPQRRAVQNLMARIETELEGDGDG